MKKFVLLLALLFSPSVPVLAAPFLVPGIDLGAKPMLVACKGAGAQCNYGSECCNLDCRSGACNIDFGKCAEAGGRCQWGSECCNLDCRSGACNKDFGKCVGSGGRCEWGSDCCSRDCRSGSCR